MVQVCDFVIMFDFFGIFFPGAMCNVLWIHLPFSSMKHQEVWVRDQLLVITAICSSGTGDAPVDCELSPSCPESVLDTTRHSQWFSCGGLCSWIEHALTRPPKLWSEPFGRLSVPCRQVRPAQSCCFGTHWPGTDSDVLLPMLPLWC